MDFGSPGIGVTSGCESPDMRVRRGTWVLRKNSAINHWAISLVPISLFFF